jgi:hypothetical protein
VISGSDASLTLSAPVIKLMDGFQVSARAQFHATAAGVDCSAF